MKTFNYDEGHAGRFSVPGNPDGASLSSDFIHKQPNPLKYIMKHLSFRPACLPDTEPQDEVTIFVPGLNTLHQRKDAETTTPERLIHYVASTVIVPMAQIHIGTSFDQGGVRMPKNELLRKLISLPILPEEMRPEEDGEILIMQGRQIDAIQTFLSQYNIIDTPIKRAFRKLFESTRDRSIPAITLVVYSRAAVEVEAALRKYISTCVDEGEDKDLVEKRLRQKLTVLTVGPASSDYPDGPAYVHLAAWTDTLSNTLGVTAKHNVSGAGKDAVFLNCDSPYHPMSFENHNFGAVTSQYLGIVLAMNKAKGIRDLWEKAQRGELKQPKDGGLLVRAMIKLTNGEEWIWNPEDTWKGVPENPLPQLGEAKAILAYALGDEFVERVVKNITSE